MTIKSNISIARTPVFAAVRRALRAAFTTHDASAWVADPAEHQAGLPRREFLKRSALAGAWLGMGAPVLASCGRGGPRVAIVGAGIAGLNAAYVLKQSGVKALVYDASDRAGGRILTARDAVAAGGHAELGGEFIDAAHSDMLALVKEFGLEVLDRKLPGSENFHTAYFFGGRHYSEAQVIEAFQPLVKRIAADARAAGPAIDYAHASEAAQRLDALSLSAYLDQLGMRGWLRDLVQVACVSEFGLDAQQQSALNFLTAFDTRSGAERIATVGARAGRFVIKGGNEQITQALAQRLESQLRLQHTFEMIKMNGNGYTLLFRDGNKAAKEEQADIVILALPFSVLREATIDVPLPDVKRKAIEELGYGSNAKLLAGFDQRVWRATRHSGEMFTDEPLQTSWDHTIFQSGERAGMTFFLGGRPGVEVGHDPPEQQINRLMVGLERAFPGARAARGEKVARFHWPTHPHSKGSYACYTPGQWTSIAGAESQPVGKIFFAGEHCSRNFRGYMNGAAESGRHAAESILLMIRKS